MPAPIIKNPYAQSSQEAKTVNSKETESANPYASANKTSPPPQAASKVVDGHDARTALGHICNGSCHHGPKHQNSNINNLPTKNSLSFNRFGATSHQVVSAFYTRSIKSTSQSKGLMVSIPQARAGVTSVTTTQVQHLGNVTQSAPRVFQAA
ncbi:MAG: hypothetical protein KDK66_07800, partial [Deltaproteobacteria bacterium]|nr:hypothetical protein [Deltaproteobacteria bacterium]